MNNWRQFVNVKISFDCRKHWRIRFDLNNGRTERTHIQNKDIILKSKDIVFIVIFVLEGGAIIMGNTFTIFVFWTQRSHLKRTCFLLINLAVADLPVGITEPIVLGTEKIPRMKAVRREDVDKINSPFSAFQVFGSSMSVIFLCLISLERVPPCCGHSVIV